MNTTLSQPVRHSVNVPIEQFYVYGVNNIEPDTLNTECIVRDDNIPNRYWLKFPPTWRTSEQKERIIGFRSLWMNRAYQRFIGFWIEYEDSSEETKFVGFNLKDTDDFIERLNKEMSDVDSRLQFTVSILNNQLGIIIYSLQNLQFKLTLYNDDTINVFNSFDAEGNPVEVTSMDIFHKFNNVWDRDFVMFTSSIATNTSKNEVGFSEARYMPVKYFKVNSNETEFWIDLWIAKSLLIPAVLPRDGRDGFNLEVIFLHDNDELYT